MSDPVRAKKHLGQHFLNDEGIAKRIVDSLTSKIPKEEMILEIGPGMGVLTKYLISEPHFLAIDVDSESVAFLKKTYPEHENQFMLADFLKMDLDTISNDSELSVIGNFPYNISSQIMFKILENKNRVRFVVGMFQKEVAERIAESPGSKTYGILSVFLQAYYNIEYLFTVHENVFKPAPKVKSAVIRLERNSRKKLDCDEDLFFKVVKTTFNQRRKTIRNTIKSFLPAGKKVDDEILNKRPEQLSVEQFVYLTNLVQSNLE